MNPSTDATTTTAAEPVPVGVIGCGRMGRLHARVLSQMARVKLVGVVDTNAQAAEEAARQYGCEPFADAAKLLPHVRAVTIAVPTQYHLALAEPRSEEHTSELQSL